MAAAGVPTMWDWLRGKRRGSGAMDENGEHPIDYTIEARDCGEGRGVEFLVHLVNGGEEPVVIHGAKLQYLVDRQDKWIHDLAFPEADRDGRCVLEPHEIATGHYHVPDLGEPDVLRARVYVDYAYHDHRHREKVSQRLETKQFPRR